MKPPGFAGEKELQDTLYSSADHSANALGTVAERMDSPMLAT